MKSMGIILSALKPKQGCIMDNTHLLDEKMTQTRLKEKQYTFVPKSVKAIAILFLAISKFGDIARHLSNFKVQP